MAHLSGTPADIIRPFAGLLHPSQHRVILTICTERERELLEFRCFYQNRFFFVRASFRAWDHDGNGLISKARRVFRIAPVDSSRTKPQGRSAKGPSRRMWLEGQGAPDFMVPIHQHVPTIAALQHCSMT